MKPSPASAVRDMYDATADAYAKRMDAEIDLPVYADTLGRLHDRIAGLQGALIDAACGSGHVLRAYRDRCDRRRSLLGVDLSPRMAAVAAETLGSAGQVVVGDMRDLRTVDAGSAAAVLNWFALHHLDPDGARAALEEWHRVLQPGGQLVVAAWEGEGAIDYGGMSDIVAFRYRADELAAWSRESGFSVSRCVVEPVEGFPMDAIYLEGVKPQLRSSWGHVASEAHPMDPRSRSVGGQHRDHRGVRVQRVHARQHGHRPGERCRGDTPSSGEGAGHGIGEQEAGRQGGAARQGVQQRRLGQPGGVALDPRPRWERQAQQQHGRQVGGWPRTISASRRTARGRSRRRFTST